MIGLFDTHTLLWALQTPERLGPKSQKFIEDTRNTLLVSVASAYELTAKVRLGKLEEAASLVLELEEAVADAGYEFVAIDIRTALRAGNLPVEHRDPFDRILAATALERDIVLLSKDRSLDVFGVRRVW